MSFVRNLIVVSTQFVPKVLTTLKKDHLTPMGMVEHPEALLFFVNARINVDWVFRNAKIPPKGFRCLWIDDEGDFARTGRLVDSWFGTHFVAHEELRIKGSEMDRLQAEYTKDGFLTLCSQGKEFWGREYYTNPETWQVPTLDGYLSVVGVTTIPSRKGKPETWQVTLADGEEFVVKGVNTRTAKKNAEYTVRDFPCFNHTPRWRTTPMGCAHTVSADPLERTRITT